MRILVERITNNIPVTWESDKEKDEFLESLRDQGQLHAIIVRPLNNPLDGYEVVTGAKRHEAARLLGWTEIDAEVKEPNDVDAKIMRVHENLHRHNLPWYEAVVLVQQLHELRQQQHGKKEGVGRPKKDEKVWGVRDTASELSLSIGGVSEDLSLARAVAYDPSLKNIKDRKTAIKLVRRTAKRMQSETMAAMAEVEFGSDEIYLGDSAEVLGHFPEETFDVCITDPPWLNFFDPRLTVDERTLPVFKELYRVMKADSFLYVIVSVDDFVYYGGYDYLDDAGNKQHRRGALEKIGFRIAKTPVFWQKENSLSRRGVRTWEYDRDFEFIMVAAKGNPVLARTGNISAFKPFPQVPPAHLIHPNEKPIGLLIDIVEDCSFKGSIIVDPFGGSGVTAAACIKTDRRYVVIERDKNSYDAIAERLTKLREAKEQMA
jgi:site-specific DNA-methyltransferase (adenine-specific)